MIPQKYYQKCNNYNITVILAPPWHGIFINDTERPESFNDSVEIYGFLKEIYIELGFNVIELPKPAITNRVQFIQNYLNEDKDLRSAK